nr:GH3 auxin-responsive promoter family protein [Candidatus Brachybacter algidus]
MEKLDSVETFPASEGFFAFQDEQGDEGMLLNTKSGIYFEFIESSRIGENNPPRFPLEDVRMNVPYALVINNNAGLWGYSIGDIVTFISIDPYKIVFSGRVAHYISAFGEHVIAKEVEDALLITSASFDCKVSEFTVAPQVNPPEGGLPYHEWFVEFDQQPSDINEFINHLDQQMTVKTFTIKI